MPQHVLGIRVHGANYRSSTVLNDEQYKKATQHGLPLELAAWHEGEPTWPLVLRLPVYPEPGKLEAMLAAWNQLHENIEQETLSTAASVPQKENDDEKS